MVFKQYQRYQKSFRCAGVVLASVWGLSGLFVSTAQAQAQPQDNVERIRITAQANAGESNQPNAPLPLDAAAQAVIDARDAMQSKIRS